MRTEVFRCVAMLAAAIPAACSADALVLEAFGFAGGQVKRLDELTGAPIAGWSFSPTAVNPNAGQLSGLLAHNGVGYVSSLNTGEVFHFDLATGAPIGTGVFATLPQEEDDPRLMEEPPISAGPGAMKVGPDGLLYVSDNTGTSVLRFNLDTGAFVDRVVDGLNGAGGLGFQSDGSLIVTDSTLFAPINIYRGVGAPPAVLYDPNASLLVSPNGLLVQPDDDFLVADLFSNTVLSFQGDGAGAAAFPQSFVLPHPAKFDPQNPPPGALDLGGGFYSTFPSDVDFDAEGNILITTLGVSSVVQGASENYGSILRYTPDGVLIERVADDLFATSSLVLVPGIVDLAGDYNRDSAVDATDYELWRQHYGRHVTPYSAADGNGDGVIDAADYTVWRDNWAIAVELAVSAAPEPAGLALSALVLVGGFVRRRR